MEKWIRKSVNLETVASLKKELPFLDDEQIKFLVRRGFDKAADIQRLLNFSEKSVTAVEDMIGYDIYKERVLKAIKKQEVVTIFGDYDVDGVTGTAVLVRFFRLMGLQVNYYVNSRFQEGFGINCEGVDSLLAAHPDTQLIVSVDNGIMAMAGVEKANSLGIDVLITDHHEPDPSGILPNALAVIDAKRLDETAPFKELCGCALAYKLSLSIIASEKKSKVKEYRKCLSLVAMATVCDVMPLIEENRYFVKEGLTLVNDECMPLWSALKQITLSKTDSLIVNEETFGYTYGPLINAIGRLHGRPLDAITLMVTEDEEQMRIIVNELTDFNAKRKELSATQQESVYLSAKRYENDEFLLISGDYHEGIAGILAGRLKEKTGKPTIVLCKTHTGEYKGSGRSVEGFNLKDALDANGELMVKFGGHAMAAGLTIEAGKIEALRTALNKLANDESFYKKKEHVIEIDYVFEASNFNYLTIKGIKDLAPFGNGFAKPVYGVVGLVTQKPTYMKDKHFKCVLQGPSNEVPIEVFSWNCDRELVESVANAAMIKAVGAIKPAMFKGRSYFSFTVENGRIKEYE